MSMQLLRLRLLKKELAKCSPCDNIEAAEPPDVGRDEDCDVTQSLSIAFDALRLNCSKKLSICTSIEFGVPFIVGSLHSAACHTNYLLMTFALLCLTWSVVEHIHTISIAMGQKNFIDIWHFFPSTIIDLCAKYPLRIEFIFFNAIHKTKHGQDFRWCEPRSMLMKNILNELKLNEYEQYTHNPSVSRFSTERGHFHQRTGCRFSLALAKYLRNKSQSVYYMKWLFVPSAREREFVMGNVSECMYVCCVCFIVCCGGLRRRKSLVLCVRESVS